MAVRVRLRRIGGKNDVCYRVVAADSRSPRDGRFLENLGWYDPKNKGRGSNFKLDRIEYWRSKGALLSATVTKILKEAAKAAV